MCLHGIRSASAAATTAIPRYLRFIGPSSVPVPCNDQRPGRTVPSPRLHRSRWWQDLPRGRSRTAESRRSIDGSALLGRWRRRRGLARPCNGLERHSGRFRSRGAGPWPDDGSCAGPGRLRGALRRFAHPALRPARPGRRARGSGLANTARRTAGRPSTNPSRFRSTLRSLHRPAQGPTGFGRRAGRTHPREGGPRPTCRLDTGYNRLGGADGGTCRNGRRG